MKSNSYMDRAMRATDPRFTRILGKLGYKRSDMVAEAAPEPDDELSELRAEYRATAGKRAYHAWDEATLREKIAEAKDAD